MQSLTGFNYPTPCTIIVGSETMLVESVSNGVMTVVRGWDGTTATTHASGVKVMVGDIPVNTFANGDQINPSITMDADGEFVVTWLGENRATGQWNIYAQRYNSTGEPVGGEFQVNTKVTDDLVNPQVARAAVAMNAFGQFVIVWAMMGQSFSYFNTHGRTGLQQRRPGGRQRVPGELDQRPRRRQHPRRRIAAPLGGHERRRRVRGHLGRRHVAGQRLCDQHHRRGAALRPVRQPGDHHPDRDNGQQTQSNVEFQVNIGSPAFISDYQHLADHHLPDNNNSAGSDIAGPTQSTAQDPQVAMDSAGNFIITWEMFEDNNVVEPLNVVNSWGIYYRRFSANGTAQMAVDHQANLTITAEAAPRSNLVNAQSPPFAGNQVNPSIAMDADGDYVITWDGPGATANPFDPEDIRSDIDSQGVFVRTFHGQGLSEQNEAVTPETTVNTTLAGYQGLSSVAMTPDGSYVIDWAGNGVGSNDGIYVSRCTDPVDNSGPVLTGVELPSATNISSSLQVNSSVQAVVVTFDKDMLNDGSANSVTNVNNYKLLMNGVALSGGISKIYYGLNEGSIMAGQYGLSPNFAADNKYEAVVVLDGNGTAAGLVPLLNGQYQIVVEYTRCERRGQPPEQFRRSANERPSPTSSPSPWPRRLGIRGHAQFHLDHRPGHRFRRQRRLRRGLERRQPEPSGVGPSMYQQTAPSPTGTRSTSATEVQVINSATGAALGQRRNPGQQRPDGHQCGRGPQRRRQLRGHLVGR